MEKVCDLPFLYDDDSFCFYHRQRKAEDIASHAVIFDFNVNWSVNIHREVEREESSSFKAIFTREDVDTNRNLLNQKSYDLWTSFLSFLGVKFAEKEFNGDSREDAGSNVKRLFLITAKETNRVDFQEVVISPVEKFLGCVRKNGASSEVEKVSDGWESCLNCHLPKFNELFLFFHHQ